MKPHKDLGRLGAVCPFARQADARGLIGLEIYEGHVDAVALQARLLKLRTAFISKAADDPEKASLMATVLLFPDARDSSAFSVIQNVQRRLKPAFVAKGLMIGEFFPGCAEPGIWNRSFRPLDAPIALLAIRNMVEGDIRFLLRTPSLVPSYLLRFGFAGIKATMQAIGLLKWRMPAASKFNER